ncbi:MAG: protein-disulfide reductase DsbD [Calditrichia bacterium]
MKIFAIIIILLAFFSGVLAAQSSNEIISVKVLSSVDKFRSGQSYPIALQATIKPPFHINSHEPREEFLIPTTAEFKLPEGVTLGKLEFPKPEIKTFAFSENPLAVYENTIYIFTTLSISPDFSGDQLLLEGTFGYQACDDQTCRPPEELLFKQEFPMAAPGEAILSINLEVFEQKSPSLGEEISPETEGGFAQTVQSKGLLLTFILVFIGGLALNLTPCVYPLIPITISYFGGQAEGKKGSLVLHAIIYVLGMAVTYSVLGVIAALTGSLFGAALQNPYVLGAIAVILVALALSMFDLYEIRVPAFLSNFAGGARQGYFGTLFMGLTVGIVAAPCIGPFVLALLTYVGEKGSVLLGFWLFFVLALGLGVPFLFLGIFSGSISRLPRSGAWMVWVRSIFGFILIAMAVYFLSPLFPNTLFYHLTLALILLIGGIYLAWIDPTQTPGKVFPLIRNLIGILFFGISLVLAASGIQNYVGDQLHRVSAVEGSTTRGDHIQWQPFSEEQLQRAAREGKPVMIDFYADWCIPCKELDKFTFSDPEVIALSRKFVMLKVDLTQSGSPESQRLKNRFQIKGVPTLVFLTPEGEELSDRRVVGFMNKEEFLPIMQSVLEKTESDSL